MTRRHSGSASEPSARVGIAEQHDAAHALRVSLAVVGDDARDDARRVGGRRAVDGNEPALLVEVVLDEGAGRDRGSGLGALRRQHLDDLRRVQHPAPARGDDPLGAVVERLQRLARWLAELDGDAAAGGAEDAQRALVLRVAVAHADPELDHLEPESGARAREAADDLAGFGRRELHRRPRVQQQAVPVQPAARGPAGLERAHRLERAAHHPLQLGQGGDAAVLVAHGREVAHLGQRDEPLVARVLVRGRAEEVDVLRGRQALEVELAQPPHVHPLGHHRMQAAERGILGVGPVAGARERAHVDRALARLRRQHEHDARDRVRQPGLGEQRAEIDPVRAQRVDVGEQRLAGGDRLGVRGERPQRARQVFGLAERGDDVMAAAVAARRRRVRTGRRRAASARVPSSGRIR